MGPFVAQQGFLAIVLAGALALLGFSIASRILSQARDCEGVTRLAWILFTGLVAGGSTWAAYFASLSGLGFGTVSVYDAVSILALLGLIVVLATGAAGLAAMPPHPVLACAGVPACFAASLALLAWYAPSLVTIAGKLVRPHTSAATLVAAAMGLCGGGLAILIRLRGSGRASVIGQGLVLALAVLLAYAASIYGLEVRSSSGATFVAAESDVTRTVYLVGLTAFVLVFDLAALAAVLVNSKDRADQLRRTRELVDAAVEGIMIVRDGKISSVNRPILELTGRPESEVIGTSLDMHILPDNPSVDLSSLSPGQNVQAELIRPANPPLPIEVIVNSLGRSDGAERVLAVRDISQRLAAEKTIRHLAHHDSLTGLPNRVLLNERLQLAATRIKRGEMMATHLIDLDRFKVVNDTLGHPVGDKLLKMAADRIRATVQEIDTIARIGGDEFAVLQVTLSQSSDATTLAQSIIDAVSEPYVIDGHHVVIGTSIGIAIGPIDDLSPDQLMRKADLALYRAKSRGRSTYQLFEPDMDAQVQAQRSLERDMRNALPAGEFELYYQPIFSIENNQITGLEALLRWQHPKNGIVAPDRFIPLAEATGFIVPLGEWVLRNACAAAATWPNQITVSVNVSPLQIKQPGLVPTVLGALAATGLQAHRLELEITETSLLDESETILASLHRLRELGVRIAMDDFGMGYSSLGYLHRFPFDRIKIDRSFIKGINDEIGSLSVVRAVVALAKGLGIPTTAEGVETEEQYKRVRAEGCTEVQGFLLSEAMPAHQIQHLPVSREKKAAGAYRELNAAHSR